jgi:hypothetical protein
VSQAAIPGLVSGYGAAALDAAAQRLFFFARDCGGRQGLASANLSSVAACKPG